MKLFRHQPSRSGARRGFTIIEIALCLGIIGFALVAIIAVLPRGLDVQKRNREETIIGEDADVWINNLRAGSRGSDELTNYVMCITNFWTKFNANYTIDTSGFDYYTPSNSGITSISPSPGTVQLTNGARIIGLLSMPKTIPQFIPLIPQAFQSNYVVAYVRAFSGAAVDKPPQANSTVLADAFMYRMIVENFPYAPLDTNGFCLDCAATNGATPDQMADRTNLLQAQWLLLANAHDFRLKIRWPVLPNGTIPNYGAATFRTMVDGELFSTNDPDVTGQPLYFVQSSTFVTNSAP
jgi:type II secretory pathway pseudopilin PulG